MITMENWANKAIEKITRENNCFCNKSKNQSQLWKEKLMAPAVLSALKDFCQQSETFAKSVVRGKDFGECLTFIAKGTGNALSDLEAYRKAVAFYTTGATVKMQLTIELPGGLSAENDTHIVLNLLDLLS